MSNEIPGNKVLNILTNHFTTTTPKLSLNQDQKNINWSIVKGATKYEVFLNGGKMGETKDNFWTVTPTGSLKSYQVRAIDEMEYSSFLSEPVNVYFPNSEKIVELGKVKSKDVSYLNLTTKDNTSVPINVHIDKEGWYFLDFRYANGNGTIESENKCGIRTLIISNEKFPIIFPQRGMNAWENWGYTNSTRTYFAKGNHTLTLALLPENSNMNVDINEARVDFMRFIYAGEKH